MKTTEAKRSITNVTHSTKRAAPFLQMEGQEAFFSTGSKGSAFWGGGSGNEGTGKPFFSPATIQPKLIIGQPGDKYEQEADAMADQVVQKLASSDAGTPLQPKCATCAQEDEEKGIAPKLQRKSIFESNDEPVQQKVQRKCTACEATRIRRMGNEAEEEPELQAKTQASGLQASSDLESRLGATKGGGSPLPENTRGDMESAFGADFSGVRVHTNSGAVQMNQELGAQAFTHGSDVYFNSGKYSPGSREGQRLLGHELTHVVQQGDMIRKAGPKKSEEEKTPKKHIAIIDGRIVVLTEEEIQSRKEAFIKKFRIKIDQALSEAESGKEVHVNHMEKVRGVAGLLSDWWNDIIPPWTGMWSHSIFIFNKAKKELEEGNIKSAYNSYEFGMQSLTDSKNQWNTYLRRTIEGAEATVTTLKYVRDGALAIEVGLITGGTAYAAGGGGLLVTGGATTLGVLSATATAATLDTPLGRDVRGTVQEIKNAGLEKNLKYAAYGLAGIIVGIGQGLEGIGKSLFTLFTDPKEFINDLIKLPDIISELYQNRKILWDNFQKKSPEEQAFAVGQLTGQIEAILIATKATEDIKGALKDIAAEIGGGSGGMALSAQGGWGTMTIQLNGIRVEAIAVAAGQTITAAAAGGLPIAVPHSFMSGMEDALAQLGEGPHSDAMHETGKAGIGAAEKPKHHVFPKEHRKWFEKRGFTGDLDIDNFCVELEPSHHEAIHGGGNWKLGKSTPFEWNNKVMKTLREAEKKLGGKRKISVDEIVKIVEDLMKQYQIPKDYIPYK